MNSLMLILRKFSNEKKISFILPFLIQFSKIEYEKKINVKKQYPMTLAMIKDLFFQAVNNVVDISILSFCSLFSS